MTGMGGGFDTSPAGMGGRIGFRACDSGFRVTFKLNETLRVSVFGTVVRTCNPTYIWGKPLPLHLRGL